MANTTKQSLLGELISHIFGRKYYCVLLSRPNIRVKGTDGKHPYEMSSDIFFTEEEAKEYYHRLHDTNPDAVFTTHSIVSFRTHIHIPEFNMQRQKRYMASTGGDSLLY